MAFALASAPGRFWSVGSLIWRPSPVKSCLKFTLRRDGALKFLKCGIQVKNYSPGEQETGAGYKRTTRARVAASKLVYASRSASATWQSRGMSDRGPLLSFTHSGTTCSLSWVWRVVVETRITGISSRSCDSVTATDVSQSPPAKCQQKRHC